MGRSTADYKIDTPTARKQLPARVAAYWRTLIGKVHLGYQRSPGQSSGIFLARLSRGGKLYTVRTIGPADDEIKADGLQVFSYEQAEAQAPGLFAATAGGKLTINRAVENYLDTLTSSYVEQARGIYNSYVVNNKKNAAFGQLLVANASNRDFARFKHRLFKQMVAEKTKWLATSKKRRKQTQAEILRTSGESINRFMRQPLKTALNHAFKDRKNAIPSDRPWKEGLAPFKGTASARRHHYTEATIGKLIHFAEPDLKLLITGAWYLGTRPGIELADIVVSDFNPDARTVHIIRHKTKARDVMLITPEAVEFFAQLAAGRGPDERMFVRSNGDQWYKGSHTRPMKRALKAAGLSLEASMYAIRHSYISRAIAAGVPTKTIADNCGTSIRMIETMYAHLFDQERREHLERFAPKIVVPDDATIDAVNAAKEAASAVIRRAKGTAQRKAA